MADTKNKFSEAEYWLDELCFDKDSYNKFLLMEIKVAYDDDCEKVNLAQKNAFDYVNKNQKKVLDALYLKIFEEYPKLMIDWHGEAAYSKNDFPKILTIEDVSTRVSLDDLYLHDEELDGFAYYGFAGECSWDPEHGFGMLMYKDEIIKFGDNPMAFSGSREIDKHRHIQSGTYDIYLKEEAEWEAEHQKRYVEFEKQTAIKAKKNAKKWWEFWK